MFGGYPSFRRIPRLLAWQRAAERVPFARPAVASALAVMPSPRSAKLREGFTAPATIRSAYLVMRGLLGGAEVHELLRPGPVREASAALDAAAALSALAVDVPDEPGAATSVLELRGYMHNQLLRDTDVMSMAHSLEVRVPFLDHPLVEFAARLPGRIRVDGGPPKWLLVRALGDRLPPDGELVNTLSPGGLQQLLKRQGRLWFVPDGSMYVYYVPAFWMPCELTYSI